MTFALKQKQKAKRKREYKWFLYTKHAITNRVIVDSEHVDRDNGFGDVHCLERGRCKMWRVPREFVEIMKKNEEDLGLQFEVYVQEGNGEARLSPFDNQKRKRKKEPKPKDDSQGALF